MIKRTLLSIMFLSGLALSLPAQIVHAFPVPALPAGNLLVNPWFRSASDPTQAGLDGWTNVLQDGVGWDLSHKPSDPSPDIIDNCASEELYCGTSARWAVLGVGAYPGMDAYLFQVVSADSSKRRLVFFTHWVSHRVEVAEVTIYGGSSPNGPWTSVWVPFYHTQEINPPNPPEGHIGLWSETGFVETTIANGYSYYKVEIHSRYPEPARLAGDVGFKISGVYFSASEPGDAVPVTTPTQSDITPTSTDVLGDIQAGASPPATDPDDAAPLESRSGSESAVISAPGEVLLLAQPVSVSQVELVWSASVSSIRGYKLERSLDGQSNWTEIGGRLAPEVVTYLDEGLKPGTTYYYQVRTSSAAGGSNVSNVVSATTLALPEPPASPADLTAVLVTATQLNLFWQDMAEGEDGFIIERSADGSTFTVVSTVGPDLTSFTDTDLQPSANYLYRVSSFIGESQSPPSSVVSVFTVLSAPAPAEPVEQSVARSNEVETADSSVSTASISPSAWLLVGAVMVLLVGLLILVLVVWLPDRKPRIDGHR